MDKNIETYLKDPNILNIIKTVSGKFTYSIDQDDISSISMDTLWRCIQKYDSTRGAKFTSYLYQQLSYAFKNELKKKKRSFACACDKEYDVKNKTIAWEILNDLPDEPRKILEQKFYGEMTMAEIGSKNGYSRETARRRLKKALKLARSQ